ncbi:MAG: NAD(P)-binding domain-containing protein [Chitinophagales bacterium]
MNIAVIGSGNVGGALALQWAKSGHQIFLGVRDVNTFKGQQLLQQPGITALPIKEAAQKADVILIAAVPQATQSIVSELGNVDGKVIIDAMNSVRTKPEGFNNSFEALKALCPNAEVVKCFNTTGFENMQNPSYHLSQPAEHNVMLDMFVAGNSAKGKEIAQQLSADAGFGNCYNFGGDDKAALLEQFALSWINLAIMQGHGRNIAFKVIKREA